ncbi:MULTISPECIES: stage V sporulation protein AA [unclassified Bacillus (in: firmicutes)]|uniref:stage V sporulation protein AA n=1 Tax=unclassified Bacillus (in: firmicutes) TaxID=185979 RepID=UPI001BEAB99F|nr:MULTISPECIES: stage V sporulation protein AA [unclassified Bacillus (in: firmicutes)]MBT2638810.1 stage V sporulation protein AA [Bacillus sp. ISL-39]MBT2660953.1 stage V sporulation protein AA [Bacillus sp. ISL-45]
MEKTIYIRMRNRVQVKPEQSLLLKDIAQIIASEDIYHELASLQVKKIMPKDHIHIIDVMKVIRFIAEIYPDHEIQTVGPPQTIIEVIYKKKGMSIPFFILVWFLLFFGAALTIMNFHEDVSMQSVHQRLYFIMTGKEVAKPLLFQIPYSIGIGLGMILFFNHVFKKRLNEEPSPLEVEMFNYQQSLDQYVILHENKESVKHLNDD